MGFQESVANSKTAGQFGNSESVLNSDYFFFWRPGMDEPLKIQVGKINFNTDSFIQEETKDDFPAIGDEKRLYFAKTALLEGVEHYNVPYVWDNTAQAYEIANQTNLTFNKLVEILGFTPENVANKGVAGGYAPTDENNEIPVSFIPGSIVGVVEGEYVDETTFYDTEGVAVTPSKNYIYRDIFNTPKKEYRWGGSEYFEWVKNPGSTDEIAEGTNNLYFTIERVRQTLLTGFSTNNNSAVTAADNLITAIGKLQAQVNAIGGATGSFPPQIIDLGDILNEDIEDAFNDDALAEEIVIVAGEYSILRAIQEGKNREWLFIGQPGTYNGSTLLATANDFFIGKESAVSGGYTPPSDYTDKADLLANQGSQVTGVKYTMLNANGWNDPEQDAITHSGWATVKYLGTTNGDESDYDLREQFDVDEVALDIRASNLASDLTEQEKTDFLNKVDGASQAEVSSLESRVIALEGAATPQEPISYTWNTGDSLTFSLPKAPSAVDINGSLLSKWLEDGVTPDEWSLSGTTVTLNEITPEDGSNIQFHFGQSIGDVLKSEFEEVKYVSEVLYDTNLNGIQGKFFSYESPQGKGQVGFGFPVGDVNNFTTAEVVVYYETGFTVPTQFKAVIKKIDYNGDVIGRTENSSFNPISEGENAVVFTFPELVQDGGDLWLEIYCNGQIGIYRMNTATVFTLANGYPPLKYSGTPSHYNDEILGGTLLNYDVYAKFNEKQVLLTQKGSETLVSSRLKNKSLAILGDSIIMLMSNQSDNHDTQTWDELKLKLGVSELINCGIGGAKWADRGDIYITSSPVKGYPSGFISNEVRMLQRLVSEGRTTPDVIAIAAGTNDFNYTDNYDDIMSLTFTQLEASEADRMTFFGGIRYSLELITRNFPNAQVILFTPIQSATHVDRSYTAQSTKSEYITKIAGRYSTIVVDALNESGIIDLFEVDGGQGKYLGDGIHPNVKGKELLTNFFADTLNSKYHKKPII